MSQNNEEVPMPLNELTPAQIKALLEVECTETEKDEVRAAVRQLVESSLDCLTRSAGQSVTEGLVIASELHSVRACFARRIGRMALLARRRYLDRTLHSDRETDQAVEAHISP